MPTLWLMFARNEDELSFAMVDIPQVSQGSKLFFVNILVFI